MEQEPRSRRTSVGQACGQRAKNNRGGATSAKHMPIAYFDNHATTQIDPRVLDAMLPYFSDMYGNASSRTHLFGWQARRAVDRAREQVAAAINAHPNEIVFTSGATESANLAINGLLDGYQGATKPHLVTVATEHRCVLDTIRRASERRSPLSDGTRASSSILGVETNGLLDISALASTMDEKTLLVAVMAANNEIGVLQDLDAIGSLCRDREVCFFSDAAQAFGKVPLDVTATNIDLMALSAHKIHGPKGIGALYLNKTARNLTLEPQITGGAQERGLRAGTLPVALVVGFGVASDIARAHLVEEATRIAHLRDMLWEIIQRSVPSVTLNGHAERRLPGNLNVTVSGVESERLIVNLKEVALSSGSACDSEHAEPSHVLRAIGLSDSAIACTIRIGLSRFTDAEEVRCAAANLADVVAKLRNI